MGLKTGKTGRPRKSAKILEMSGAFNKNPQRRRFPVRVVRRLNTEPPNDLPGGAVRFWREMLDNMSPDIEMSDEDRRNLALLATYYMKMEKALDKNDDFKWMKLEQSAFRLSVHFGMTPMSRVRFEKREKPADDSNPYGSLRNSG